MRKKVRAVKSFMKSMECWKNIWSHQTINWKSL